jgi:hypothetical protein
MAQRHISRLLAGVVLLFPIVAGAAPPQQPDFRPSPKIDFTSPKPAPANLSITMPQAGDQQARLRFTSETATVDAKAQRVEVTYTKIGLIVEMVSGTYTQTQYSSPWQSKSAGEFKTLSLTFGTNGELASVSVAPVDR